MKRFLLWLCAIGSLVFVCYSTVRLFAASMAASAVVGVPSQVASLHYYGRLSSLWLAGAVAGMLACIASIVGIVRHRSHRKSADVFTPTI
jgi:hypothetical protein